MVVVAVALKMPPLMKPMKMMQRRRRGTVGVGGGSGGWTESVRRNNNNNNDNDADAGDATMRPPFRRWEEEMVTEKEAGVVWDTSTFFTAWTATRPDVSCSPSSLTRTNDWRERFRRVSSARSTSRIAPF